jgi:hypothetical protein
VKHRTRIHAVIPYIGHATLRDTPSKDPSSPLPPHPLSPSI